MRICMVLEGCYPYVRGGVSSWMHSLITSNPQHDYVLWVIGAKAEDAGKFKYELPSNVKEVHEVFLDSALSLSASRGDYYHFTDREVAELKKLILSAQSGLERSFSHVQRQKGKRDVISYERYFFEYFA